MPQRTLTDLSVPSSAAAVLWLTQYLQPILQAAVLILTILFIGLGVVLRWRQLRDMHGRYAAPHTSTGDAIDHIVKE
jgi:hypothetical protein